MRASTQAGLSNCRLEWQYLPQRPEIQGLAAASDARNALGANNFARPEKPDTEIILISAAGARVRGAAGRCLRPMCPPVTQCTDLGPPGSAAVAGLCMPARLCCRRLFRPEPIKRRRRLARNPTRQAVLTGLKRTGLREREMLPRRRRAVLAILVWT